MINLGQNQKKILKVLSENEKLTVDQVANISGVRIDKTKNILSEYHQADIVRKIEDKYYSIRDNVLRPRNSTEDISMWTNVMSEAKETKLKNLARVV